MTRIAYTNQFATFRQQVQTVNPAGDIVFNYEDIPTLIRFPVGYRPARDTELQEAGRPQGMQRGNLMLRSFLLTRSLTTANTLTLHFGDPSQDTEFNIVGIRNPDKHNRNLVMTIESGKAER